MGLVDLVEVDVVGDEAPRIDQMPQMVTASTRTMASKADR
jgi:hypothetical protein